FCSASLGDFLEKGGKVYSDVSAVHDNGDTASSLIVTLPRGRKVSAQIVSD
ncbi:AvrPphF family type III effector, partial [Pseudomonas syringae]|uniref:AvrPphF family type III effector n=1 Tax=Pseudomonas syringae TaxID=317 RepID=UPI001FF98AF3